MPFCQIMGGDIKGESEIGRGSTFTIRVSADCGGREGRPIGTPLLRVHLVRSWHKAAVAFAAPVEADIRGGAARSELDSEGDLGGIEIPHCGEPFTQQSVMPPILAWSSGCNLLN